MKKDATVVKTLKLRIRDKHAKVLNRMAFECNQLWNKVNEFFKEKGFIQTPNGIKNGGFTPNEIIQCQIGFAEECGFSIPQQSIEALTETYFLKRKQFGLESLKWRVSGGRNRTLGWIPFKKGCVRWKDERVHFNGHTFKVWDSYGLSKYNFCSGSFTEDARGHWYFNVVVRVPAEKLNKTGMVGIDLGVKVTATCSNGLKLDLSDIKQKRRLLEKALRANKWRRAQAIKAKIVNSVNDRMHKFTTKLTRENVLIVVGDVSNTKLGSSGGVCSDFETGWLKLNTQLKAKSQARQTKLMSVDESFSTQKCSSCGEISDNSPRGKKGLSIREWTCPKCGSKHDRDVNAARNILAMGRHRNNPYPKGVEDVKGGNLSNETIKRYKPSHGGEK